MNWAEKLQIDRPLIMGILNVTPDSFSDGGRFFGADAAFERAREMIAAGADIIDVGGESTRPGSEGVDADEEIGRVVPVIERICDELAAVVSIDTTKLEVATRAIEAGARIINDVSMLRRDEGLAGLAADRGTLLVLMHSRKTPKDMQRDVEYDDVVESVKKELLEAAGKAMAHGVPRSSIWLDPGIGFAKNTAHNLEVLFRLPEIVDSGFPVLVGPSRKAFIGKLTGAPVGSRVGGTAAAVTASVLAGARAVRVHDVEIMAQTVRIAYAIAGAGRRKGDDGGTDE